MNTWLIKQLESYPEYEGWENVVFRVHWGRQAVSGDISVEVYGVESIKLDANAPFTPYEDLTLDQVCNWLNAAIGAERIAELDEGLARKIEAQLNPTVISLPLPW